VTTEKERKSVVIVEYDPRWPTLYVEEKRRILAAIGSHILTIEHIGSTAVPGLGAKPIIDIMVGLRHLADAPPCIPRLQAIGYEYVPEHEQQLPERRYFHKGKEGNRTHHLHMVETASEFWHRHLLFRDYLRAHPDTAQQYYELKKGLADQFRSDREAYTEGKTAFIKTIEARARRELVEDI
jgi:GrpB-like predicted nucleotidyltransferase (UPF0157 family)